MYPARRPVQEPVGGLDMRLEADHALGQFRFEILIVERKIIDLQEIEGEFVRAQPRQSFGQFAIERGAAIAANHDGNVELFHGRAYFRLLFYTKAR